MTTESAVGGLPGPIASPGWWRSTQLPPPSPWLAMMDEFTGESSADEWGLAAAIFIARTRRTTSTGPTFAELFQELLPETGGMPAETPQEVNSATRNLLIGGFRIHCALAWHRRAWISWTSDEYRSLRVGLAFRERARAFDTARGTRAVSRSPMEFDY